MAPAKKNTTPAPEAPAKAPSFDFESLTLGETALIEDLSGQSISAIADMEKPKGKAFAAIVMVIKRRNGEPGYTFNQALEVPLSEANALLGDDEDDEAADASGEGSSSGEPASD